MLVMTRKRDESILVDGNIEITVVEIRGDKVRLGVRAPKEVPVHRREVYESILGDESLASVVPADAAAMPRSSGSRSSATDEAALVWVNAPQLALLDRLRQAICDESGAEPRREQTLGAILAALDEARDALGKPLTLEHLRASLVAAIKESSAR